VRESIAVKYAKEIKRIPVHEIRYFRAEHKYVSIFHSTYTNREALIPDTIKVLKLEFDKLFIQVNRNLLIAKRYIKSIVKRTDNKFYVKLDTGTILPVSRRYVSKVKAFVQKDEDCALCGNPNIDGHFCGKMVTEGQKLISAKAIIDNLTSLLNRGRCPTGKQLHFNHGLYCEYCIEREESMKDVQTFHNLA